MKKARETVAEVFNCPFCNYSKTVECKMDRKKHLGTISCRICGANFQMMINHLTEPIDIYSDWVDESRNAQEGDGAMGTSAYQMNSEHHQDDDMFGDTQFADEGAPGQNDEAMGDAMFGEHAPEEEKQPLATEALQQLDSETAEIAKKYDLDEADFSPLHT